MRIAQFTSSLLEPLGGAEQYVLALAGRQHDDGHDVTVVTGWIDSQVASSLRERGIRVLTLESPRPYRPDLKGPDLASKLRFHGLEMLDSLRRTAATRAIEREGFDVVHVHRFAGFGASVLAVRGARVVHTVHDYGLVDSSASLVKDGVIPDGPSRAQRLRHGLLARRLSSDLTVIFPTEATRDRHAAWGLDLRRVDSRVIPHGWPEPRRERGHVGKEPGTTFLYLGKLEPHKGIALLLEAWGDGVPAARLRVGGDGLLAASVRDASSVEHLGWLDSENRTVELDRADALVLPSQWPENFPIVVAESLLTGTPVITTTVAAPPLVDDGISGLVVAPDPVSLRRAFADFAADPELRARLAAGAAARSGCLDMALHSAAIIDAYRSRAPTVSRSN